MCRKLLGGGSTWMLLAAGPLMAQFSQLATTDDGQQIYFTSPLRLRSSPGSGGTGEGRLYRLGVDGITLVAERGNSAAPSPFITEIGIAYPQVSADGSVLAFTYVNQCAGTTPGNAANCTKVDQEATIQRTQTVDLGRGSVQLSRNGRWALLTTSNRDPQSGIDRPTSSVIDLSTGERAPVPNPAWRSTAWSVTSDGTILIEQEGPAGQFSYGLWKQGSIRPLVTANVAPAAISDDASVVLLSWGGQQDSERMGVKDLATGRETMFFEPSDRAEWATFMGMSKNGSRILYRRMPEYQQQGDAYVYDTATAKSVRIALPAGELVAEGTLSGSGESAVLATTAGRLVKVNLADNAITTLIPATPYVEDLDAMVPGSVFHLRGTLAGPFENLSGEIALNGQPVPVVYARDGDIAIQVPWEQTLGIVPFRMDLSGSTPFIQNQSASVLAAAPRFERAENAGAALLGLKIIRGDWSGLVDTPPAAGNIIHLYMTGLGPVEGKPQTGLATAVGPLFPITGKIACGFNASGNLDLWESWAAETLFAGLAPGMTGIYQVSMRLPAYEPTEVAWLVCQVLLPNGFRSAIID